MHRETGYCQVDIALIKNQHEQTYEVLFDLQQLRKPSGKSQGRI